MSHYSSTMSANSAVGTGVRSHEGGFWSRFYAALVKAREEQARRELNRYFSTLSDQQKKDLGYPSAVDRR